MLTANYILKQDRAKQTNKYLGWFVLVLDNTIFGFGVESFNYT